MFLTIYQSVINPLPVRAAEADDREFAYIESLVFRTRMAKQRKRGDFEATNLRDCCTPRTRMAKRCERGDLEVPNLR